MSILSEITISSWNIRGLGDKYIEEDFLKNIKYDINVILETWKGESVDSQIEGFVTISKSRRKKHTKSRRHSGGIIIYIKKTYFQRNH